MYMPIGGNKETIEWYDAMCARSKLIISPTVKTTWYCDMGQQLRAMLSALRPPPPPEPPPFVAVKTPPADITKGSVYEQWFKDQQEKQEKRNKNILLLGAVGLVAYLVLKGKL